LTGDPASELTALADAGVRYLIVHKDQMGEGRLTTLASYLPVDPVFTDEDVDVYRVHLP
jgi:hypothetical protein